jgi:hypothetical protein
MSTPVPPRSAYQVRRATEHDGKPALFGEVALRDYRGAALFAALSFWYFYGYEPVLRYYTRLGG